MLDPIYQEALFEKHILVNHAGKQQDPFETLFSLANLFNIRITSGQELATKDMIHTAGLYLGRSVPTAF